MSNRLGAFAGMIMFHWIWACLRQDEENIVVWSFYQRCKPSDREYLPVFLFCFPVFPYLIIRIVIFITVSIFYVIQVIEKLEHIFEILRFLNITTTTSCHSWKPFVVCVSVIRLGVSQYYNRTISAPFEWRTMKKDQALRGADISISGIFM